jgi:DNA polymerase-3 subunit gamma/tau
LKNENLAVRTEKVIEAPLQKFKVFEDVLSLIRFNRDMKLLVETENYLRLVKYQPGRIEFQLTKEASSDLPSRLSKKLNSWTGAYWGITIVNEGGGPTIAEQRNKSTQDLHAQVMKNPMVKLVLENFPGSIINEVHLQKQEIKESISDELINNEEEWDPFEDNNLKL